MLQIQGEKSPCSNIIQIAFMWYALFTYTILCYSYALVTIGIYKDERNKILRTCSRSQSHTVLVLGMESPCTLYSTMECHLAYHRNLGGQVCLVMALPREEHWGSWFSTERQATNGKVYFKRLGDTDGEKEKGIKLQRQEPATKTRKFTAWLGWEQVLWGVHCKVEFMQLAEVESSLPNP